MLLALSTVASIASSILSNAVKIGFTEQPSSFAMLRAVTASMPCARVMPIAASIIFLAENWVSGAMIHAPFIGNASYLLSILYHGAYHLSIRAAC